MVPSGPRAKIQKSSSFARLITDYLWRFFFALVGGGMSTTDSKKVGVPSDASGALKKAEAELADLAAQFKAKEAEVARLKKQEDKPPEKGDRLGKPEKGDRFDKPETLLIELLAEGQWTEHVEALLNPKNPQARVQSVQFGVNSMGESLKESVAQHVSQANHSVSGGVNRPKGNERPAAYYGVPHSNIFIGVPSKTTAVRIRVGHAPFQERSNHRLLGSVSVREIKSQQRTEIPFAVIIPSQKTQQVALSIPPLLTETHQISTVSIGSRTNPFELLSLESVALLYV